MIPIDPFKTKQAGAKSPPIEKLKKYNNATGKRYYPVNTANNVDEWSAVLLQQSQHLNSQHQKNMADREIQKRSIQNELNKLMEIKSAEQDKLSKEKLYEGIAMKEKIKTQQEIDKNLRTFQYSLKAKALEDNIRLQQQRTQEKINQMKKNYELSRKEYLDAVKNNQDYEKYRMNQKLQSQQDYSNYLQAQVQAKNEMKYLGTMTNTEKKMNKGDLRRYKNFEPEYQTYIPGIYHIPGVGSRPTARGGKSVMNFDNLMKLLPPGGRNERFSSADFHQRSQGSLRMSDEPKSPYMHPASQRTRSIPPRVDVANRGGIPDSFYQSYNPITNPIPNVNQNPILNPQFYAQRSYYPSNDRLEPLMPVFLAKKS